MLDRVGGTDRDADEQQKRIRPSKTCNKFNTTGRKPGEIETKSSQILSGHVGFTALN